MRPSIGLRNHTIDQLQPLKIAHTVTTATSPVTQPGRRATPAATPPTVRVVDQVGARAADLGAELRQDRLGVADGVELLAEPGAVEGLLVFGELIALAAGLAERAGLDDVEATAQRAGIRADMPPLPAVALGATAVRPMELVTAYTPFATLGYRVEPRFVTRVEDRDGNVVWRARVRRRRVMDRGVAFLITNMMRGVVDRGTGSAARAALGDGIPAAGKTGTTNGATDAWFVGFTPQRLGAVWIGFDRPRTITAEGSGGRVAAPVWGRIMRVAMRGQEAETWKAPGGVVRRQVTVSNDRVVAPGCRARGETYTEYFLRRHVPDAICPRGTRRDERSWWERTRDDVGTRMGEWAREQWDDLRGRARKAVGREDRVDPDAGTRPARGEMREPPRRSGRGRDAGHHAGDVRIGGLARPRDLRHRVPVHRPGLARGRAGGEGGDLQRLQVERELLQRLPFLEHEEQELGVDEHCVSVVQAVAAEEAVGEGGVAGERAQGGAQVRQCVGTRGGQAGSAAPSRNRARECPVGTYRAPATCLTPEC